MDFISISLIFTVYTTFVPVVVTIHSNESFFGKGKIKERVGHWFPRWRHCAADEPNENLKFLSQILFCIFFGKNKQNKQNKISEFRGVGKQLKQHNRWRKVFGLPRRRSLRRKRRKNTTRHGRLEATSRGSRQYSYISCATVKGNVKSWAR